ncbi:MAG: STAS/SEC14 domain-containing protein [Bacteroidetes bacterium]|nr:STAS/SEC14 domain-containing protein [Bacteroidota bacterium]
MTTIEVRPNTRFGEDEILNGVSKLDTPQLEKFVRKVLALRARRMAPTLSGREAELMLKINEALPETKRKRLYQLEEKRRETALPEGEENELTALVDELEKLTVQRVKYLGELAQLREVPVRELMRQLDIQPARHA